MCSAPAPTGCLMLLASCPTYQAWAAVQTACYLDRGLSCDKLRTSQVCLEGEKIMRRTVALVACLSFAWPAVGQDGNLEAELDAIRAQLEEVEEGAQKYDAGLILGLLAARREALLVAQTLVENRIAAEAGEATLDIAVSAVEPDVARAAQILGEMATVQQRIEEAEREAAGAGGLIQALVLSRLETERLSLAQLQMGYLQAKYGIAFPVIQTSAAPNPTISDSAGDDTVDATSNPGAKMVAWADERFPSIDYSLAPFQRASENGEGISGWWTVERTRAAVDDSPQVTAINHSAFSPSIYGDQTALIVRCSEGETAFILIQDDYLINDFRSNVFEVTLRIDEAPPTRARWNTLTNNKGAGLFGTSAEPFIRSIYDAKQLFIRIEERNGQKHDAVFDLAGAQDAFEAVAGACGWTTLSLSADDYRAIQTALNAGGYDVGNPDGQWGPASKKAMREYQASVGLEQTGAPDRPTLRKLGLSD